MVEINEEFDKSIQNHSDFLIRSIYYMRENSGDVIFSFPAELNSMTGDFMQLKAHSSILKAKSPYFKGLFEFN